MKKDTKPNVTKKSTLNIYLVWLVDDNEKQTEHGHMIIAHDEDEATRILVHTYHNLLMFTISEAPETTKTLKHSLKEMYEKQNILFLGV